MRTLISMVILLVMTASCTNQVKPYKTWECHKPVKYIVEWRGNCVIYEAIVEEARKLAEIGARPYSVRMNGASLDALAGEERVVRHRLSSGGAMWVVDTEYGAMRVIKDDRLGDGQFIVGRGWNVSTVSDRSDGDGDAARELLRDGAVRGGEAAVRPEQLQPSPANPDNDVEF